MGAEIRKARLGQGDTYDGLIRDGTMSDEIEGPEKREWDSRGWQTERTVKHKVGEWGMRRRTWCSFAYSKSLRTLSPVKTPG